MCNAGRGEFWPCGAAKATQPMLALSQPEHNLRILKLTAVVTLGSLYGIMKIVATY